MNVWSISSAHRLRILVLICLLIAGMVYYFYAYTSSTATPGRLEDQVMKLIDKENVHAAARPDSGRNAEKAQTALTFSDGKFILSGKTVRFFSGAMHYFRVVPQYWKQRLQLLKAANLNTVETYVAWNLHEEIKGEFNFSGILDLRKFIHTAQEVGLYVILRPGPYICSEWEFGGLPSWLLHDPKMVVRSLYKPFLKAVDHYFKKLFAEISDLQYSRGGPIVAMQVENEYGAYSNVDAYLLNLRDSMRKHGVKELLFTSDNKHGLSSGSVPGELITGNFKKIAVGNTIFQALKRVQPKAPLFAMEFWSGWFDKWGGIHETMDDKEFEEVFQFILDSGASVNIYMFHGGTNFGFMNGANGAPHPYAPLVTSYDYDAPITESGQLTSKYHLVKRMLQPYVASDSVPLSVSLFKPRAYGSLEVTGMLRLEDLHPLTRPIRMESPVAMEMLNINNEGGQGYGFTLYRTMIGSGNKLEFPAHSVRDYAVVMLNGEAHREPIKGQASPATIELHTVQQENFLDILVENQGRVNYGVSLRNQRKGLLDSPTLDGKTLHDWEICPMEFKEEFLLAAKNLPWHRSQFESEAKGPGLYSAQLTITGEPQDTFLDMQGWTRGVVFVNLFNIGRYWIIGPQQTLYVPAPLLRTGDNEILVFEIGNKPGKFVESVDTPHL